MTIFPSALTLKDLQESDSADPLATVRDRFVLPEAGVYFCGNSLGPLPRATKGRVHEVLRQQWGQDLIRSWTRHDWIDMPLRMGDKIGRIIGALPGEVAVADSTSINLFKLLAAALRLRPGRNVLLAEEGTFPTDLYMMQGLVDLLGGSYEIRIVAREALLSGQAFDPDVALACLSHVQFRDGALHDVEAMTALARDAGALVLWDLAHSAGAMPLHLHRWKVDLAVGCGYKYLNGGPGAPAFLYVAKHLQQSLEQPLWGWLGHAEPFALEEAYRPADGIRRTLCGTPPILSLAALEAGCDLFLEVDLEQVGKKGRRLGHLFLQLVDETLEGLGIEVACPRETSLERQLRGSQVCLRHPDAFPIVQALIERGIAGDFRAPDVLRFGLSPLILRYADLWQAVASLREVLETRAWDQPHFHCRGAVT